MNDRTHAGTYLEQESELLYGGIQDFTQNLPHLRGKQLGVGKTMVPKPKARPFRIPVPGWGPRITASIADLRSRVAQLRWPR